MNSFSTLSAHFEKYFSTRQFPLQPASLYDPAQYILAIGGKRVRPVSVLMAGEMFDAINDDLYKVATAIELFHNFTLVHDDIMDKAPLRRGMETVHQKFGESTALLAGDVMLVQAYEVLASVSSSSLSQLLSLFNQTAKGVCEGQQLDMDFEKRDQVHLDEYLHMITLKTSVLLAAAMQMGAIVNGATAQDQKLLYSFGKNLGIAFQIQDDYLDAFGDSAKVGKQPGGDILADKKTFLVIRAYEMANAVQKEKLLLLQKTTNEEKISGTLQIFKETGADTWANDLKDTYYQQALQDLHAISVDTQHKLEMKQLASFLMHRES